MYDDPATGSRVPEPNYARALKSQRFRRGKTSLGRRFVRKRPSRNAICLFSFLRFLFQYARYDHSVLKRIVIDYSRIFRARVYPNSAPVTEVPAAIVTRGSDREILLANVN